MEHPARKITKIAREAEHLVLLAHARRRTWARRRSTASTRCGIIPGVTQTELADTLNTDKPAIARRTASLERKGYLRREPNPKDGRSQLLYPTEQAEGLRNAKAEAESAFYDYLMDGSGRCTRARRSLKRWTWSTAAPRRKAARASRT